MRHALVVDLETASIDGAEQYIEPVEAPANYKDVEKIAAYVKVGAQKALDKCALDPDLCRIVAIGWQHTADQTPTVAVCHGEGDERDALEQFWREAILSDRTVIDFVTFNGLRFDLPVLLRRSMYLRVPAPALNLDKYRTPHIDLMARLTFNGVLPAHSLRFYLSRFGIQVDDMTTGKDIAQLVRDGKWDEIANHCRTDVIGTKALAERIGAIRSSQLKEAV